MPLNQHQRVGGRITQPGIAGRIGVALVAAAQLAAHGVGKAFRHPNNGQVLLTGYGRRHRGLPLIGQQAQLKRDPRADGPLLLAVTAKCRPKPSTQQGYGFFPHR